MDKLIFEFYPTSADSNVANRTYTRMYVGMHVCLTEMHRELTALLTESV